MYGVKQVETAYPPPARVLLYILCIPLSYAVPQPCLNVPKLAFYIRADLLMFFLTPMRSFANVAESKGDSDER